MSSIKSKTRDPVFLNCRRETWVILTAWALFFAWVTGYCGVSAYREPEEPLELAFGMPSWVFWGVFLPWVSASAFTIWFSLWYVADDPLEVTDQGTVGSGPTCPESGDGKGGTRA